MAILQDLLLARGGLLAATFPRRPESIFEGVEMPVAILLSGKALHHGTTSSRINRFYTEERPTAIENVYFTNHSLRLFDHRVPKIGTGAQRTLIEKVLANKDCLGLHATDNGKNIVYYQEACRYWAKAHDHSPVFRRNGELIDPPHGRTVHFTSPAASKMATCVANSTLFYFFYSVLSDCEHINDTLFRAFPIPSNWPETNWGSLCQELQGALRTSSKRKTIKTKQGHVIEYDEMDASSAKPVIDQIDQVLAKHYGFTDEELDFIINYDIKYRMGRGAGADEDDEA